MTRIMGSDLTEWQQGRVLKAVEAERARGVPHGWTRIDEYADADEWRSHQTGLRVIRGIELHDDGRLWLHVSYSIFGRASGKKTALPDWRGTRIVKDSFVGRDRKALIVLPPAPEYFSFSETLHLWHCLDAPDLIPDLRTKTGEL